MPKHTDSRHAGAAMRAALAAKLVEEAPTPVRLHPNLSELYRQKVADLHLALADPQIGPEALALLRSLIERIVVRPLPEGGFELEIIAAWWLLANPLQATKKPPGGGSICARRAFGKGGCGGQI